LTPEAPLWIDGSSDAGDRLEFEQQVQVDHSGAEVEQAAAAARDARDHLSRCLDQQEATSAGHAARTVAATGAAVVRVAPALPEDPTIHRP
jgi:hypothetical protein